MSEISTKRKLSAKARDQLLKSLKAGFENNMARHRGIDWAKVTAKLEAQPQKLWSLHEMEMTGGEPDVISQDNRTGEYIFVDCSAQTPEARASLCYDDEALNARKEHKPKRSRATE